jgi:23S rRNA pseudouridine1911/1915/1917 synthase
MGSFMQILFCDNHLLVALKPSGIPTQDPLHDSAEKQAKEWVKKTYDKKGAVFLEPVHRLDKPVKGLLLFARTSKALSRLQNMMRERQIEKTYHAWVEGVPHQSEAFLEHYLVHEEFHARVASSTTSGAKKAVLHYKVLKTEKGLSLLEITLHTGRYHQIRVQLAAMGCPIVGDQKYGSTLVHSKEGIGLTSSKMQLVHPVTKEPLCFQIELV